MITKIQEHKGREETTSEKAYLNLVQSSWFFVQPDFASCTLKGNPPFNLYANS